MSKTKTKPPATTVEQRLARPRETPEQRNARRLAAAEAKIREGEWAREVAVLDTLADHADAAGAPSRYGRAIRSAWMLYELMQYEKGGLADTREDWLRLIQLNVTWWQDGKTHVTPPDEPEATDG